MNTEEKGDTATVTITVTNVDMMEVIEDYLDFAFSGDGLEAEEALKKAINTCINTKTKEVHLELEKTDGKWKIVVPEDDKTIIDAFLGGYFTYFKD